MTHPAPDPRLILAQRINTLLQRELAQGIDVQRMLAQALYARDVLLVCEAMRGSDLAGLAQQFRDNDRLAADANSTPSQWPDSDHARPSIWPQFLHWPASWRRTSPSHGKPGHKP